MKGSQSNFQVLMRDRHGRVVPGSVRRGHNVMTQDGRDLILQLLLWGSVGTTDVALTHRRARYIGVGGGYQAETPEVVGLVDPLEVTSGIYLQELDAASTEFPIITTAVVKAVFLPAEITYSSSSVVVSEAGLYFDVSPGGVLSPSSPTNVPAFYKSFAPLVKLDSFSMEITWELRF